MKKVPFFPNTSDDTHCVQACFRMVLKYFLPDRDFTWEELDQMTQKQEGKGTWWFPALSIFQTYGISSKLVSSFDYQRFFDEGENYLKSILSEGQLDYYINKSNLFSVRKYIPDFLRNSTYEKRQATIDDVVELLRNDWLVGIELNAKTLNKEVGFSPHMVIIFNMSDTGFILHDPGLPSYPDRNVTFSEIEAAWSDKGKEKRSLVAFRKQTFI